MSDHTTWPIVRPDDPGIRPAGRPDECFYCRQTIGQLHGPKCVCVYKRVRYRVLMGGVRVGTYERNDPYFWDEEMCNFHKNDSSWCADNALEDIEWSDPEAAKKLDDATSDRCSCGPLVFEFDEVADPGPFTADD